jgi:excisionase family DNA binding protein
MIEENYTLIEVAKILKIKQTTVYRYVVKGLLKGFQVGGYWRVTESELKNFIDTGGTTKTITPEAKTE